MHAATWLSSREPSRRTQLYGVINRECCTGACGYTDFSCDSNAAQTSPPVKSPTWPNEPNGRPDHEDFPDKGVGVQVNKAEEVNDCAILGLYDLAIAGENLCALD